MGVRPMDPDTTLTEIRRHANTILDEDPWANTQARRLAELVLDLDPWLSKDGFAPKDWQH